MLIRLTTCQKKSCRLLSDVLDTLHCWKAGEAPPEEGWVNPSAGCEIP